MKILTDWDTFIGHYVTIPRAGYVLVAFAIVLAAIVVFKLLRDRDLARFAKTTEGAVVGISVESDVDHTNVRFLDYLGRAHEFRSDLPRQSGSVVIGTPITVRYDPSNPKRARQIGEPLRRAWLYLVYLIVAAGFGLVGFKFITAP